LLQILTAILSCFNKWRRAYRNAFRNNHERRSIV
jgi:hypothetical protein